MAKHMMRMPTAMSPGRRFAEQERVRVPRNVFDMSRSRLSTFDGGYLVPIFTEEVLPADTWRVKMRGFARIATLLKPLMDNVYLDIHFWFVPNRLLWTNWEKFCGAQENPSDSTDFIIPTLTPATASVGTLSDYFGLPINVTLDGVSAMWHRAYLLIWNRWYRDENLQNSAAISTGNGPDANANMFLQRRGKRFDYFTSCLTAPQKGAAVSLPLGTVAPVLPDPVGHTAVPTFGAGIGPEAVSPLRVSVAGAAAAVSMITTGAGGLPSDLHWEDPALFADLSAATAATINQLRAAFATQQYLERDARGGTRYVEKIFAHFGVRSPDARLQRPEYLGGGTVPLMVSPIAQNSASPATPTSLNAQGNLAGIGTASWDNIGFVRSFPEHGVMVGLISARADLRYQQGIRRMFLRSDVLDFAWPDLAHLGEQPVFNKEIFAQGTAADDDTFGYQEQYASYRYAPSEITGLFRSDAAGTLEIWHSALDFGSLPTLGSTFIVDNPPFDRNIAVPAEPHFISEFWFDAKAARPLPLYGTPGLRRM